MMTPHVARAAHARSTLWALALVAATVPVLFANGCSDAGDGSSTPPPLATGEPEAPRAAREDASTPVVDASVPDVRPTPVRFAGTLAKTKTVDFGGPPYCTYRVTLEDVTVDVTVEGDVVTKASVTARAVEATVPPCPNPPIPTHLHTYALASSLKLASGGLHIAFDGAETNKPPADLILEGPFDGEQAVVSLEWQRTDQVAPFAWRILETVTLNRQ